MESTLTLEDWEGMLRKPQLKQYVGLISKLGITTEAEKRVLIHIIKRDKSDILVYDYEEIKETNGWVMIKVRTNKHSLYFSELALSINKGNYSNLYRKIS